MMRIARIKKRQAPFDSSDIRLYLNEYGAVRIETNNYRCEMRPEEFLARLRKAAQQQSTSRRFL